MNNTTPSGSAKTDLLALLAQAKAKKLAQLVKTHDVQSANFPVHVETQEEKVEFITNVESNIGAAGTGKTTSKLTSKSTLGVARDDIILNDLQQRFCDRVLTGSDIILVGAAGTGKTTSVRQTSRMMLQTNYAGNLSTGTKYLFASAPGIAVLSYTRKAVNNIRHAVVDELKPHVLTIHKLLEFNPVFTEIEDPANPGIIKKIMRFEPKRNEHNPLPSDLKVLLFEESSMIGVELYAMLQAAMPHAHQEIFLGDIQQLPPVFGSSILAGLMALKWLSSWLEKGRWSLFGIYCLAASATVFLLDQNGV